MAKITSDEAIRVLREKRVIPCSDYPGRDKPWQSQCEECGESISPRLANILAGHSPCKYCSGKALRPGVPEQFCREASLTPLVPYPGDQKKKWHCRCEKCGTEVWPRLGDLMRGQGGCINCGREVAIAKTRIDPSIAYDNMLAAGALPLEDYPGSIDAHWLARCLSCGEVVSPRLHSIRSGQGPCRDCGRKVAAKKIKTDATVAIETMIKAHLKPLVPYPGAAKPWLAICLDCGLESSPQLSNVQNGSRCTACSRVVAALKTMIPEAVAVNDMRLAGFEPIAKYSGSSNPWLSRCTNCGKESSPRHASIVQGRGCRFCGRDRVSEIQRIPQEAAIQIMRNASLEPLEPYMGISKPWKCRCLECGNSVTPSLSGIKAGQGGCVYCSRANIIHEAGSTVYLIHESKLGAMKVGVGNVRRIEAHSKKGWAVLKTWEFETVQLAYKAEKALLTHVREELGLPEYLDKSTMPQGGYTETFSADDFSDYSATKLFQELLDQFNLETPRVNKDS